MYIRFLGAIGTVTGSMTEMYDPATDNHFLVDCGVLQGEKRSDIPDWTEEALPFSPSDLDFIILTHAHLDHVGLIPKLIREGFDGKIWCTEATRDLTELVVKDCMKINGANDQSEVMAQLKFEVPDPGFLTDKITLADGLTVTFLRNTHIVGACTVQISWQQDGDWRSIAFAGDIGINREDDAPLPLLAGRQPPYPADYTVMESTYGDQCREPMERSRRLDTFRELMRSVVEDDRIVILPSFAIQRAQEVLFDLYHAKYDSDLSAAFPLVVHSPMLQKASRIIAEHLQKTELKTRSSGGSDPVRHIWMNRETAELLDVNPYTQPDRLAYLVETALTGSSEVATKYDTLEDWGEGFSRYDNPSVGEAAEKLRADGGFVIASAGMCVAGPVVGYLEEFLENGRTTVALTGFCAPGTLGSRLQEIGKLDLERRKDLDSDQTIELGIDSEKTIPAADIRAEIFKMGHYSGHTDQEGLIEWLVEPYERVDADAELDVYVVHGTSEGRKALRDEIERRCRNDSLPGVSSVEMTLPSDVEQWYDLDDDGSPVASPPVYVGDTPSLAMSLEQLVPYDYCDSPSVEEAIENDLPGPVRHAVTDSTSADIQRLARTAREEGSFAVLTELLDLGADFERLDRSPLEVLEQTVRSDAADAFGDLCQDIEFSKDDVLHAGKAAVEERNWNTFDVVLSRLAEYGLEPAEVSELVGLGLLNFATKGVFERLIDEFDVEPNYVNADGMTLLHMAAIALRAQSRFERLLQAGVEPDATTEKGQTVLHLVAITTKFTPYKHWIDEDGDSYTQEQRDENACDVANTLFDAAPQLFPKRDSFGRTALHYSANIGSRHLSLLLANRAPGALNIRDDEGWTPIELARANGFDELSGELRELE